MKMMWMLGAAAIGLGAMPAMAQQKPAPLTLTAHAIRGGAYWLEGGRSNTGFVVGTTGVVLIDTEMTPDGAAKGLAEIAKVTPKKVDAIVVSHADPDHIGGLPFYPGVTQIIEHENTWSEVIASAADAAAGGPFGQVYVRMAKDFKPTRTIAGTETVTLDGVKMQLIYTGPAHTAGDLIVYLPQQKVVYAADLITTNTGRFPVIHLGGSSLGWITAMKAMLALDADTFVAGHGAFEDKAKLAARIRDVEGRRAAVKAMVMAGKTLAEVERALPEPGASPMFPTFTQTVYAELTKGYPPASPPWANLIHH